MAGPRRKRVKRAPASAGRRTRTRAQRLARLDPEQVLPGNTRYCERLDRLRQCAIERCAEDPSLSSALVRGVDDQRLPGSRAWLNWMIADLAGHVRGPNEDLSSDATHAPVQQQPTASATPQSEIPLQPVSTGANPDMQSSATARGKGLGRNSKGHVESNHDEDNRESSDNESHTAELSEDSSDLSETTSVGEAESLGPTADDASHDGSDNDRADAELEQASEHEVLHEEYFTEAFHEGSQEQGLEGPQTDTTQDAAFLALDVDGNLALVDPSADEYHPDLIAPLRGEEAALGANSHLAPPPPPPSTHGLTSFDFEFDLADSATGSAAVMTRAAGDEHSSVAAAADPLPLEEPMPELYQAAEHDAQAANEARRRQLENVMLPSMFSGDDGFDDDDQGWE